MQCIQVDQYIKFKISFRGSTYSTNATNETDQAENISDNGGVKMAYRALQKLQDPARNQCVPGLPFSANQLFWVTNSCFAVTSALFICR